MIRGTRTQVSKSRRTTCDICRERKVRCDKEQPICERCKRLNFMCTYTPGSDLRDDSQTMSELHERIAKAEAIISALIPATEQSPSQFAIHNPAPSGLGRLDTPSSNPFLQPDDPGPGYFPNIDDTYLSQDFLGSWAENADKITTKATMTGSLLQLSDLSGTERGLLEKPFIGAIQLQSISELQQPNITPVPSYSVRTASLSSIDATPASILSINGRAVDPNVISILYFEATRRTINIIDPGRFFELLIKNPVRHQVNAISYAVAVISMSLSDEFPDLQSTFYGCARQYIELAERQEDGTSFLRLESLQALLLILKYESSELKCIERILMTHARVMRLAKLLHMDTIDADQVPTDADGLDVPRKSSHSLAEMDERRRTFWFAFIIDFFISALTGSLPILQASEILTYLPNPVEAEIEGPSNGVFLKDAIAQPSSNTSSNFKPIIIAAALGNKTLRHIKLSTEQNSHLVYDFWTLHYKLDKAILVHLSLYPLPRKDIPEIEYGLLLTTHLTLLGVSILIHMRAFERALEAGFPEDVVTRSRQRFETLAMKISEACQQGGELSFLKLNVRKYLSVPLIWPIFLAAKAQILSIKNPIQNIDLNSTRYPSGGSLCASLRALESMLKSLGVATTYSSDTLEEIRLVLQNNGDYSPS